MAYIRPFGNYSGRGKQIGGADLVDDNLRITPSSNVLIPANVSKVTYGFFELTGSLQLEIQGNGNFTII